MNKKPLYLRKQTAEDKGQKHLSHKSKKRSQHRLFAIPGLLILIATVGGALGFNFYYSFTRWIGFGTPQWVGVRNYLYMFINPAVRATAIHALLAIIPYSIVPTFLGCFMAAVLFDYIAPRFGQAIASRLRGFLYLPQIVPLAMTGVVWNWLLDSQTGLLNQYLHNHGSKWHIAWMENPLTTQILFGIILIWLQLGFTLIIFIAGLSRIDTTVLEAAQLDGASWFKQFRLIMLPLLRTELTIVLLTTSISSLKIFAPVYWITHGGPLGATDVPSTYVFHQFYNGSNVGSAAAIATVFAVLVGVFTAGLMKIQRRGSAVRI
jgi:raffinose/stachyose/melibiose transport system permease protein